MFCFLQIMRNETNTWRHYPFFFSFGETNWKLVKTIWLFITSILQCTSSINLWCQNAFYSVEYHSMLSLWFNGTHLLLSWQLGQFRWCVDKDAKQGAEVCTWQGLHPATSRPAAQNEVYSTGLAHRGMFVFIHICKGFLFLSSKCV